MTGPAILAGGLAGLGAWLIITGLHRQTGPAAGPHRRTVAVDATQATVAVAFAAAALLATRWPTATVAAGVGGWFLAPLLTRRSRVSDAARAEALALWVEMLRDAMGTARGIEGVLVATAATAPAPIRVEVARVARRLAYEPLDTVLDDLADDLDHPLGDLVVTALRLASKAGARQTRAVLEDLASAAYREAEMYQRVEVARQRPRTAMRWTALIIAGFITLLVVFSREYLRPYGTAVGQLVLAVVALYWGLGCWWMARMGQVPQTQRLRTGRSGT